MDCKPEVEMPESCTLENIKWSKPLDIDQVNGMWYFQARHRNQAVFDTARCNCEVHDNNDIGCDFVYH